ncbi:DUF2334 domain-containing protein [Paenibacillus sp. y28]|uniref:DUF2334 domain-containing protein n=1 Tax=Paenibacillus sp. y28 TaxID=3129110 RepID=UPI00301A6D88
MKRWLHQGKLRYIAALCLTIGLFVSYQLLPAEGGDLYPKSILIRLEDIGPGGQYSGMDNLGKLRAVLELLAEHQTAYQLAVIPRWLDYPADGTVYDRRLDGREDPYIEAFDQLLTYAQQHGGVIGMHGYTHQVGSVRRADGHHESAIGNEFNVPDVPETQTEAFAAERVKQGYDIMHRAGFEPRFWEAPHYHTTAVQDEVFRGMFGIQYQDNVNLLPGAVHPLYVEGRQTAVAASPLGSVYVPTPYSFIPYNRDADLILKQLGKTERLPSFFYHPFLEFKHLVQAFDEEGQPVMKDGLPVYHYPAKSKSNLQKLLSEIENKGYNFVSITDLVPFTPSQSVSLLPGNQWRTGDVTGDGVVDIVEWNRSDGEVTVQPGKYDGLRSDSLPEAKVWSRISYGAGDQMVLCDKGRNGRSDLWIMRASGKLEEYRNLNGQFTPVRSWLTGMKNWSELYALRREGDTVVLAGVAGTGSETRIEGVAVTGNQLKPLEAKAWPKKTDSLLQVVDTDAKGLDDLLVSTRKRGRFTKMWAESGGGEWRTSTVTYELPVTPAGQWRIADTNGDGKLDVIVWDAAHGKYSIFEQVEDGEFRYLAEYGPWGSPNAQLIISDFDGNGKKDLGLITPSERKLDIALSFQSTVYPYVR